MDGSARVLRYACDRCGGYGVLCGGTNTTDEKKKCGECNGRGHVAGPSTLWEDWAPDDRTVAMLDRMPGHPHIRSREEAVDAE